MQYADIVRALPEEVAELLNKNMESAKIDEDATTMEIRKVFDEVVLDTKRDLNIESPDLRRMVSALLDQIPEAGIKALFSDAAT